MRNDPAATPRPLTREALPAAVHVLSARDPAMAWLADRHGIPPLWEREPGFATLLLIILEQQVSLASARATYDRLLARTGTPTPDALLALGAGALRSIGFSRQKAEYARDLARAVIDGEFDCAALESMPDETARTMLMARRGIGAWSADVYLLMALRRPDVWPAGDLALQVAAQDVKGLAERPSPARLESLAEGWRPWRSVAARLLWQHYLNRQPGEKPG